MRTPVFRYDALAMRYRPFPIGVARPVMDADLYAELVAAYPTEERFTSLAKVGDKLTLSEKFNPREYRALVREHPLWREFHAWIKSAEFVEGVLDALRERQVDLGFADAGRDRGALHRLAALLPGGRSERLSARFEFSMLPALGGHVIPHTDGVSKLVTLVVSMVAPGQWQEAWGGGTDVIQPRDERKSFNRMNRQLPFEEMEVLETFPFLPNQAVVFVKTWNSWHAVRPMTGPADAPMRRTLTINIETDD